MGEGRRKSWCKCPRLRQVRGAAASPHAQVRYILAAYGLAIVGGVIGGIGDNVRDPSAPVVVQGLGVFAALYVAAQAIERAVEPITEWTGTVLGGINAPREQPTTDEPSEQARSTSRLKSLRATAIKNVALAMAATTFDAEDVQEKADVAAKAQADVAAKAQAAVEQDRRNSTVLVWGLASMLGIALSGWIGLALLQSTGVQGAPRLLDVIVTGLAIGGGTKPLHDLISNLQSAKDEKHDPAEVTPA